ncbi:hypothetical protein GCM10025787_01270 [Saccharopolyspora rosea]
MPQPPLNVTGPRRVVPWSELLRPAPGPDTKTSEAHKPGAWQPHMARRARETVAEWNARLSRTCYQCGLEFASAGAVLDAHEDKHRGRA